jgi:hypothetical protein
MDRLLFPNSFGLSYQGFDIEVVPEGCRHRPDLLEGIQEQVLKIATFSRGWDEQNLDHMRSTFKLGPLYEANSLVLIRKDNTIVGLVGSVNDWRVDGRSLIHLCSLGLLPSAQRRGFLPVLLGILWTLTLRKPEFNDDFRQGRSYISAITQSPYLYAALHNLFDLYPAPEHPVVPDEVKTLARAVVHRFDEELVLDEEKLILRNECRFFYQKTPYSANRELNEFCDRNLDYHNGDVFVLVGRVIPERVEQYLDFIAEARSDLYLSFCTALEENGYKEIRQSNMTVGVASHG